MAILIYLDNLEFAVSVISLTAGYLRKHKENFVNLAFTIRIITSGKM